MSKTFTPNAPQNIIVPHILKNPRALICADMGTGKTGAVLEAFSILKITEGLPKVLVIAPLRVAKNTWQNEIKKWRDFNDSFRFSTVLGSEKDRLSAMAIPADIYITNYENLPWIVDYYGREIPGQKKKDYSKWPFKIIILDESTRVKNTSCYTASKHGKCYAVYIGKGKSRTKALAKVAHKHVERLYCLSGTPTPNGLIDLWGQIWYLDAGNRLGLSKREFKTRWFEKNPFATSEWSEVQPKANAETEIISAISDISVSISAKDYFKLSDTIETNIMVSMDKTAYKQYHKMESDMLLELSELSQTVLAATASARSVKLHQIANGTIYYDDKGNFETLHEEKLDALESILEESGGMPLIVCYKFKSDLQKLRLRFKQGRHLADSPDIEDKFKSGKIPILFLHPASAGHGVDGFQYATNKIVFYSVDWAFDTREQAIARIGPVRQKQAGLDRPTHVYNILCDKTIDIDIMERQKNKLEVHEAIMLGLKNRV